MALRFPGLAPLFMRISLPGVSLLQLFPPFTSSFTSQLKSHVQLEDLGALRLESVFHSAEER